MDPVTGLPVEQAPQEGPEFDDEIAEDSAPNDSKESAEHAETNGVSSEGDLYVPAEGTAPVEGAPQAAAVPTPAPTPGQPAIQPVQPGSQPPQPQPRHQNPNRQHAPRHPQPGTLGYRTQRSFKDANRARGRDYFINGRVSEPVRAENTLTATVRGSGAVYNLVYDFTQTPQTNQLQAKCDCPLYERGALCKHLWAGILQIDKAGMTSVIPGAGSLRVQHARPHQRPQLPPGAAGQPQGERHERHARHHRPQIQAPSGPISWLSRLDLIQNPGAHLATGRSQACFVIQAPETAASGRLIFDLWIRDQLPNGDLGPLRPTRVQRHDLHRFSELKDQETLSLLLRTGEPKTVAPFGRASRDLAARFTLDPLIEPNLLPQLVAQGKLYLSRSPNGTPDDADRPLRMDRGKPWEFELKLEPASATHYKLDGFLKREGEKKALLDAVCVFRSGFLLLSDRMCKLAEPRHAFWILSLREPNEFLIPREQADVFIRRVLSDPKSPRLTWPEETGWSQMLIEPKPKGMFRPFGIDTINPKMILTVSFDYAGREISLDDTSSTFIDLEKKKVYSRNLAFEDKTLHQALEVLKDDQGTGTLPASDLHRVASELSARGWLVYVENQQLKPAETFSINVSSETDWFDIKLEASYGANSPKLPELLAALERKDGFIRLADGSLGMLPQEWVTKYSSISQFGKKNADGTLRFNRSQGLLLNAAIGEGDHIQADAGFLKMRDKVREFDGVKLSKAPAGFNGTLRNYQKEGLTWLDFLETFEMGGVLADDMGLGKTIQILAFLKKRQKANDLPSLVVAPKSLVFNWMDEAAKFVPDLKVIQYRGAGRTKQLKELAKSDLVVTTYGTIRTDIEKLKDIEFDVAIVDEAQAIKNRESQSAQAVKLLRAKHKLALTGTPIENRLDDLFSILEFTSPGMLSFTKDKGPTQDAQQMLNRMLKPFILRRTKEKVLTELPDKSEQVLYAEMGAEETALYGALREHYRATLAGEKGGFGKNKIQVLEALLRLRQAACHPGLVNPDLKSQPSAKVELLVNQLKEVIQEGHKALVFSQFTSLLAIVKTALEAEGIVYEYLDGSTEDRKTPVERFQTDPKCPAFLISLKAGGTGLNLTAADYVFILDPWWNPAVEAQAIGRAHRMGQTQKVFAYRMIARGTVEEKILDLQKTKKELAESIVSEDVDFMKKLSKEDLELLLS